MKKGSWYKIDACVACSARLSNYAVMHSSGVCPECGHNSRGTVCDTDAVIVRKVYSAPWWKFWEEPAFEGKNTFATNWLKQNGYVVSEKEKSA